MKNFHEFMNESLTFDDFGVVRKTTSTTKIFIRTDKGTVELTLNNNDHDDCVTEVVDRNRNLDITDKTWFNYKNTPDDIVRALKDHDYQIIRRS